MNRRDEKVEESDQGKSNSVLWERDGEREERGERKEVWTDK